ncbi:hypothetical protein RRG08_021615 [Elysia crispata]|uniref:Uncharacterized protein n=1 Tax=Elysia crispata TaxID=231223 RepID=A0AAE0XDQ6_9GAST|nr:hypothetical protein RRG08_021615 [Elysia crispata]
MKSERSPWCGEERHRDEICTVTDFGVDEGKYSDEICTVTDFGVDEGKYSDEICTVTSLLWMTTLYQAERFARRTIYSAVNCPGWTSHKKLPEDKTVFISPYTPGLSVANQRNPAKYVSCVFILLVSMSPSQ